MEFDLLGMPAVFLVSLTAALILISRDWRWYISALGLQYLGMFILVGINWPIEMAVVKLVSGWMCAAVIGISMNGLEASSEDDRYGSISGSLFRLFTASLVGMGVYSFTPVIHDWLLGATYEQILGGLILMGMGVLQLAMLAKPDKAIMGLLTYLSGFEVLYATVESSILVTGILVVVNLGIAFVGAYLLVAPSLEVEE